MAIPGAVVVELPVIDSIELWAEYHGVVIEDGCLVVYKALNEAWEPGSRYARTNGITYVPGTAEIVAPDWDPDPARECGGGLHASPSPGAALAYHPSATRFVRVRMPVADTRTPRADDAYPDKVRGRRVLDVVEVTITGDPVGAPAKRRTRKAARA